MKLKMLGVLIGSLICTSAFAAKSSFTGFYAGVRAGGLASSAKIDNSSLVVFENQYDADNQLSAPGGNNVWSLTAAGDLFAGYGQFMNNSNIYLGGEAFVELSNPNAVLNKSAFHTQPNDDEDSEILSTNTKAKLDNFVFGVDFRPGYLIDKRTLVYGRLGASLARETVDSNDTFTFYDQQGNITTVNTLNSSQTRNVVGLRLGVGAERHISKNVSATIDYIYTYYGNVGTNAVGDVNTTVDGDPKTVVGGFRNNGSGKLSTEALMIGLTYKFA